VGSVGLDPITEMPVVVLRESGGDRALPIWIGVSEARSIAIEMEELHPPRPNSHDLAKRLLGELDATLERVVVTELEGGTYFAVMVVRGGGQRLEIDARPSDAIAIALRVEAPVFVRETLFEENSKPNPHREAAPELRL
jgi:bifunctional DNase/RNase